MKNKLYSVISILIFASNLSISGVQAQNNAPIKNVKSTSAMERVHTRHRSFAVVKPGNQGAKDDVPSSMDLFVDRCTDAGGGLISIDGHYDCVKPSGEPIPDW